MTLLASLPVIAHGLTPDLGMQIAGRHLGWALVLGAMSVYALRPFPATLRWTGFLLVLLACLIPGELGATWWLGLAFQTPSLSMQGIGLIYLIRAWRMRHADPLSTVAASAYARWPNSLLWITVLTGWVLALDTFAAFDFVIYSMGFTSQAVFAILSISALLWLLSMRSGHDPGTQKYRDVAVILVGSMAIHLLTRLPSGNAWDAMLDPWLWLGAQALLLSRVAVWVTLFARIRARRALAWASDAFGGAR